MTAGVPRGRRSRSSIIAVIGRVAVHRGGELAHRLWLTWINGEEGAQAGLRNPEVGGDLGPPEALLQDESHQLLPGLDQQRVRVTRAILATA